MVARGDLPIRSNRLDERRGASLPDQDGSIRSGGGQAAAVAAESHGGHVASMAKQGEDLLSGLRVPQPDRLVLAGRHQKNQSQYPPSPKLSTFARVPGSLTDRPAETRRLA